jgi:hypothetical protein
MQLNTDLKKIVLVSTLAVIIPIKANGDTTNLTGEQTLPTSNIPINKKANEYTDISSLSTKIITNSEDTFEALLYDYQSQHSIARMVWNKGDTTYKVNFVLGDIKDTVSLQISNINNLASSERANILTQGLHEAGIAWLSQSNGLPALINKDSKTREFNQEYVTTRSFQTKGFIDYITPNKVEYFLEPMENITRRGAGWAFDPDQPDRSIWVHFYGHRLSHSGYQYVGAVLANQSRPDVNRAYGISGNHGWTATVPEAWDADMHNDYSKTCGVGNTADGHASAAVCRVQIKAYGIDVTGDANRELEQSPYTIESVGYGAPLPN